MMTAGSARALIYSEESFQHRTIVFGEADSIPEDGPAASAIRSIAAEGRMVYEVTELDPKTKQFGTRRIEKEGPTGLITTSTAQLPPQMATRVLEISLSDDPDQTKAIMFAHAARVQPAQRAVPDLSRFLAVQRWLEVGGVHNVSVPFAADLARLVRPHAVRMRRDFRQLLTTIQAVALLMQKQRERTPEGWVVATLRDYATARALLAPIFNALVGETVTPAIRATIEALNANDEISETELARRLEGSGVTANALHPGFVATRFFQGKGMLGWWMRRLASLLAIAPEKGAQTSIYLAGEPGLETTSGRYFQDSKEVEPSQAARDDEAARRLWDLSARMTHLVPTGRPA